MLKPSFYPAGVNLFPEPVKRILPGLMLAMALGACASSAKQFGAPATPLTVGNAHDFTMAQNGLAAAAVRQVLLAAGFQDRKDAAFRVEVGFATRPRKLAVLSSGDTAPLTVVSPATEKSLSFCRRQAYVLTVALIERRTGKVGMRSGATISRCHGEPSDVLPLLARAALQPVT